MPRIHRFAEIRSAFFAQSLGYALCLCHMYFVGHWFLLCEQAGEAVTEGKADEETEDEAHRRTSASPARGGEIVAFAVTRCQMKPASLAWSAA